MPLAQLLHARGFEVRGSDRGYDQGKTSEKFQKLKNLGMKIVPQDGSAVAGTDFFIVSSAVEDSIPDVRVAKEQGVQILTRGQMLAELFNSADLGIAVAGTSGKSTVTGMVGTILSELGHNPTVVNGGGVINFDGASSIRSGANSLFVAEMDESDGSIAHYTPSIAALNNIALDHMSMEELEKLFGDYVAVSDKAVVLNAEQPRVMALAECAQVDVVTYGIDVDADFMAKDIELRQFSSDFKVNDTLVHLNVPGRHNIENALAALCIGVSMGLKLNECAEALARFKGIHRRMELVGERSGITVIDDFAHNPDKISASLRTLKSFDGRVIVMFQAHGFGPLRLMGQEIIDVFAHHLNSDDIVLMPEVYYAGGTVDRSVTAKHIIEDMKSKSVQAKWFETRDDIPAHLCSIAKKRDRIVIMGARDDTLHMFACDLLEQL